MRIKLGTPMTLNWKVRPKAKAAPVVCLSKKKNKSNKFEFVY